MNDSPKPSTPFALKLLEWFCPSKLYEGIEGDLQEQFETDRKALGERVAKRRLLLSVISFFRPGILLRNKFSSELNHLHMLSSYLKIMLRAMLKQKANSAITIFGLTIGITFSLLMGIFIWGELQVNQNLKDVDKLYLLQTEFKGTEESIPWMVPAPLAKQLVEQYPSLVENYYRFWDRQITVSKGDKHFRQQSMIGDSTFLSMFGFPVLYGNGSSALTTINSIVITEKIALQYFNRRDVVGESLTVTTERGGVKEFQITAVIADTEKKNSVSDFMNMDAQIFLSLQNRPDFSLGDEEDWRSEILTYVKLAPHALESDVKIAINKLLKGAPHDVGDRRSIILSGLQEYYRLTNHGAVKKLIVSLSIIALLILVLAVFNFINISIASSFSRLKEIGVRKVIGGRKSELIFQFLSESVVLAIFSGIISLLLYEACSGFAGDVLATTLPSIFQFGFYFWLYCIGGFILIGLFAGAYPAFYLSASKTINSLKGSLKSVKRINFSRVLIGAQFTMAIFIFIAALTMSRQISFFMEKDLGYDRSAVLLVTSVPRVWSKQGFEQMKSAKNMFMESSNISAASLSLGSPGMNLSMGGNKIYRPGQPVEQGVYTTLTCSDEDFINVYDLKLVDGKFFFNAGETQHPFSMVINESAQKQLSVQVGDKVKIDQFGDVEFSISGILKDFNYESLHEKVKPVAFVHNVDFGAYRYFSFKLAPGNLMASVEEVEKLWKKAFPTEPFVHAFIDEKLQAMYKTEHQLKKASSIATALMLTIVLTGVMGLVSLSVSKRTKEIGIRKVLGASVAHILFLVSHEYIRLVIIAIILAIPLAYYFTEHWLSTYAYRAPMVWWMFALPGALVFLLTVTVVSIKSLKTISTNPVDALRYE